MASTVESGSDLYEIPLTEAVDWTSRWQQFQAESKPNPDDSKKAFRVDVAELQDVINNIPGKVQYVRFYLGLDPQMVEHLVLVGVDSDDKDLTSYTYDFTKPCPNICDISSPLFNANNAHFATPEV